MARLEQKAPQWPSGVETILVVEDDARFRFLLVRSFESCGYTVLAASHGEEALEICKGHAGPIHLLLTDVVMPGMNGLELAREVMALRSETRTIIMSGHVDNTIILNSALKPTTPFFHKPFSFDELLRKVREVLDTPLEGPLHR
ncbi:MAG: response regulator [Nitrospirae bacterium]|nr:response regulator [Nitrospirota bacterium]